MKKIFLVLISLVFLTEANAQFSQFSASDIPNLSSEQVVRIDALNTELKVYGDSAAFAAVVKPPKDTTWAFSSAAEEKAYANSLAKHNEYVSDMHALAQEEGFRNAGHMFQDVNGSAKLKEIYGKKVNIADNAQETARKASKDALSPQTYKKPKYQEMGHTFGGGEYQDYAPKVKEIQGKIYDVVYENETEELNGREIGLTEADKAKRKRERDAARKSGSEGQAISDITRRDADTKRREEANSPSPDDSESLADFIGSGSDVAGGGGSGGGADGAGANEKPPEFDTTEINNAICDIFDLMEGGLGALLSVAAGAGALFAMAFGAYKAGYGLIVVAAAGFVIRSFVAIFFGTFDCPGPV